MLLKRLGRDGAELKKVAKERNLKGKLRVAKSGCMDLRAFGPNVMIWPEVIWYIKVIKEDIPEIIETYLKLEETNNAQADTSPAPVGN